MDPDSHASAESFVWPPNPVAQGVPATVSLDEAPAAGAKPRWSRMRRWARDIEDHWLMPTALPLARRMELCGWAPDAPGAYCERCGSTTGPHETDEFGCAECRGTRPPWGRFTRLGAYEGALGEWVREVKFQRNRWLGESLGRELGAALARAGVGAAAVGGKGSSAPIAVVPVPTSAWHRIGRGLDHTMAIARGVAWALDGRVVRALRRRHRPSQLSVPVSQRAANVSGSMLPRRRWDKREGAQIILIDDVMTTGATIRAAARALIRGGARAESVWIGVVSVTPDQDRRSEGERGSGVDGDSAGGVGGGESGDSCGFREGREWSA